MMSRFMGHGSGPGGGSSGAPARTLTSANSWAMPSQGAGGRGDDRDAVQPRRQHPEARGVSEWETTEEEDLDQ